MKMPLKIPPRMDGPAAEKLAVKLAGLADKPLLLNGAAVTFAGVLGLQFLIAAQRKWRQGDLAFEIKDPSDALNESCRVLGVDPGEIGISQATGAVQ